MLVKDSFPIYFQSSFFKAGLVKNSEERKRSSNSDPKLNGKRPRVSLPKVDDSGKKKHRHNSSVALLESDSEYEIEEVIELCEWYPPDFWKAGLDPKERPVRLTDVTVEEVTVTLRESKSREGFFKKDIL